MPGSGLRFRLPAFAWGYNQGNDNNDIGLVERQGTMGPEGTAGDKRTSRVIVVELDDVVERRRPDRPNLYVGTTSQPRAARYEQLKLGNGPDWVQGHIVRLRPDLYRSYRPVSKSDAPGQKRRLVAKPKRRAFTVNRDTRVWSLYIVQLDESAAEDVGRGWVYVGETSRTPQERLRQHLEGFRNSRGPLFSRVVNRRGSGLREDLMEGLPTLYTQKDAKAAEAQLAERLREAGYRVEGGH